MSGADFRENHSASIVAERKCALYGTKPLWQRFSGGQAGVFTGEPRFAKCHWHAATGG